MKKLFLAIAIVLPLAACSPPPVTVEVPKIDCLVSNVECQYTLVRGTYNAANDALIAASRAGLISVRNLEIATALSDDILILLEAAEQMIAAEGGASPTAKSILDEAAPKVEQLRSYTQE